MPANLREFPALGSSNPVKWIQEAIRTWRYNLLQLRAVIESLERKHEFQVQMTTTTAVAASYADITGYDDPEIDDSDLENGAIFSFNKTTGVLTINKKGTYRIAFHGIVHDTANDRTELHMKMVDSSGDVDGAEDMQYAVRNNNTDHGSAQISGFLYKVASVGETLKLQAEYAVSAAEFVRVRWTVEKT